MSRTRFLSLLMVALFLVTPLAVLTPASALIQHINPVQQTEIETRISPDAPYGTWEERQERSRLFLWPPAGAPGATAGDFGPVSPLDDGFHMSFEAPGGNDGDGWARDAPNPATDLVFGGPRSYGADIPLGPALLSERIGTTPCFMPTAGTDPAPYFGTRIAARAETTLYAINAELTVTEQEEQAGLGGTVATGGADGITIYVYDIPAGGNSTVAECVGVFSATASTTDGVYRGSIQFPLDGYTLEAGHRIEVSMEALRPKTLVLGDPNRPSFLDFVADTARVNLWTMDRLGNSVINFPHPEGSSTEERRIQFNALIADSFGLTDCQDQAVDGVHPVNAGDQPMADPNDPLHDANAPANECPFDGFDQDSVRFRVRDMTREHTSARTPGWDKPWQYNEYVPLDQGLGIKEDPDRDDFVLRCCDLAIEPIQYNPLGFDTTLGVTLLQYTFVYGRDFPTGEYQIEFHEQREGWKVFRTVHVGNTGWEFEFAPGEAEVSADGLVARHTVRSNEATEYVVRATNNGATPSLVAVTIPAPETAGLEVMVTPNTQTVQPGQSAEFVVTVTPPARGVVAGDKKIVRIEGVSEGDNTVKELITETTYVGYNSFEASELPSALRDLGPFGVDIVSSRPFVETRPDRIESFPVTIRNLGTIGTDFVITAEGVPSGWTVNIQPSYTRVLGASREDFLVQIHVPAEATPPLLPVDECGGEDPHPGCDWTLFIRARRVADQLIYDIEEIPVKIILIDLFATTPLNSTIQMRDVAGDRFDNLPGASTQPVAHRTLNNIPTHADVEFDDTALFRILVENLGDRTDRFPITASWNPNVGRFLDGCDGGSRVPDGWRFRMLDHDDLDPEQRAQSFIANFPGGAQGSGAAASSGFSGEYALGEIELPPRTSQYVWVELRWVAEANDDLPLDDNNPVVRELLGTGEVGQLLPIGLCPDEPLHHFRDESISREAELRVTTRSINDPALREVEYLHVDLVGSSSEIVSRDSSVANALHAVLVHAAPGTAQPGVVAQPNITSNAPLTYTVHAVNLANEHDTLSLRVDAGKNGWEHRITDFKVVPSYITQEPVNFERRPGYEGNVGRDRDPASPAGSADTMPTYGPSDQGCKVTPPPSATAIPLELTCYGMGVHDEVIVKVSTKPPLNARVGQRDDLPITVTSRGAGTALFTDTLVLQTRVQGDYFFELENLAGIRKAYPGQTIAFPFTIHNEGTERDEYDIQIVEATPQPGGSVSLEHEWRPRLCGEHRVSVPGGYDYHGCLAATIPIDWPMGDDDRRIEENFRVRVKSTKAPVGNQQSGTLDFLSVVEAPPGYMVRSEVVTVRPDDQATFEVEAKSITLDHAQVLFRVNNETMPEGYFFTCEQSAIDANPQTCFNGTPQQDVRFFNADDPATTQLDPQAIGDFTLVAPPNQLGSSRIVSRIEIIPDTAEMPGPGEPFEPVPEQSYHDAITNLATQYGVNIDVRELREKRLAQCDLLIFLEGNGISHIDDCLDTRGRLTGKALLAGAVEPSLIIPPGTGHSITLDLLIENPGLSPETVKVRNSPLPEGWTIDSSDDTGRYYEFQGQVCPRELGLTSKMNSVCLEPLTFSDPNLGFSDGDVSMKRITLRTDQFMDAGDVVTLLFEAEVVQDPSVKSQISVPIEVGTFAHTLVANQVEAVYAAPQDIVALTATVENTGNVVDTLEFTVLPPPSYASFFVSEFVASTCVQTNFNAGPGKGAQCSLTVFPGETRNIQFTIEVPTEAPANAKVPLVLESRSLGAGTKNLVRATTDFEVNVLDYAWEDIDGDGLREFAIDRNRDAADGFEQFRENKEDAGVHLAWIDRDVLAGYLDDEGLEYHTVTDIETGKERLEYRVDGNGDNRQDHLLDRDGDGMPDIYWDPYHRYVHVIKITKDVTYDGIRELFFDVNGNCMLDAFLDVTKGTNVNTGRFNALLQVHADSEDEFVDYVVDTDGDGNLDAGEVLIKGRDQIACDRFSGLTGIGQIIELVDMNGDGNLDRVVDLDGDGNPDIFFPFGQKNSIPITLDDVTGDGRADWTYPSNGRGNPDSFYDPYGKKAGFIDAEGEFLRDLKTYWWVAGLFVFVLLLFAVLVMVTRR